MFTIKDRVIDSTSSPYIIAELSANHNGNYLGSKSHSHSIVAGGFPETS